MENVNFIFTSYIVLMLLFILIGIVKANFHFKYLKNIFPKEYKNYDSWLSVFTLQQYNIGLQFLMLPYFKRYKSKEKRRDVAIAKKVRFVQLIEILLLILLLSPVTLGIIKG